jgi:hypothetical protein
MDENCMWVENAPCTCGGGPCNNIREEGRADRNDEIAGLEHEIGNLQGEFGTILAKIDRVRGWAEMRAREERMTSECDMTEKELAAFREKTFCTNKILELLNDKPKEKDDD